MGTPPFLYIDPLKQGLKQEFFEERDDRFQFLYIDPLKQGLKLERFVLTIKIEV